MIDSVQLRLAADQVEPLIGRLIPGCGPMLRKAADRIAQLESSLASCKAFNTQLAQGAWAKDGQIAQLEAALLRHGHKEGACGLCTALETFDVKKGEHG